MDLDILKMQMQKAKNIPDKKLKETLQTQFFGILSSEAALLQGYLTIHSFCNTERFFADTNFC